MGADSKVLYLHSQVLNQEHTPLTTVQEKCPFYSSNNDLDWSHSPCGSAVFSRLRSPISSLSSADSSAVTAFFFIFRIFRECNASSVLSFPSRSSRKEHTSVESIGTSLLWAKRQSTPIFSSESTEQNCTYKNLLKKRFG